MKDHTPHALASARRLRQEMSLPEVLLWNQLKAKPMGVKFRKQHPIGPYVVDFYCAEKRIAIEIDGAVHDMGDRPERDQRKDSWLAMQDIEIVRITAKDVLKDVEQAADSIIRYCLDRPPPSAPSFHSGAATSPERGGSERFDAPPPSSARAAGTSPERGGFVGILRQ